MKARLLVLAVALCVLAPCGSAALAAPASSKSPNTKTSAPTIVCNKVSCHVVTDDSSSSDQQNAKTPAKDDKSKPGSAPHG